MTAKQVFLNKAAQIYKVQNLRRDPMMDEFAIRLNAEATYDEHKLIERIWSIFEELGAKIPEE